MHSTPEPEQAQCGAMISLIIPFYNVEKYITECLESAVRQTFPRLEIICVDDNGTDNSASVVQEYAEKDSRIKVIRNAHNMGLASSRNEGMRHSSAPFIMFLDSDDSCDITMCEKMYQAIVSTGADVAMCGTQITYECDTALKASDDKYYAIKFEGTHAVSDDILAGCDVSAWNKIYRRELIDRYQVRFPDGMKYEDAYFFNAYMAHAKTITFINEKLHHYRRREGSIMNQTFAKASAMSEDHLRIAFRLHEYFRQWQLLDTRYAYFCRFFLDCLFFALNHSPSQQEHDRLMSMAGDFVRENLPGADSLDAGTAQWLERLRTTFRAETTGRLLKTCTTPSTKRYSLLGIPVYTIRYSPTVQKHYLFGIQFRRKKP